MEKIWTDLAWEKYLSLINENKKMLKKINDLLKDIEWNGLLKGIGNPEPLKDNLSGYYSRQINEKDRLIYKFVDDKLLITQCKGHYDDK